VVSVAVGAETAGFETRTSCSLAKAKEGGATVKVQFESRLVDPRSELLWERKQQVLRHLLVAV
jgi:hypothetical protein